MSKYNRYLVDRHDVEVQYPARPRGFTYCILWSLWAGFRYFSDIRGVRLRRAEVAWPD